VGTHGEYSTKPTFGKIQEHQFMNKESRYYALNNEIWKQGLKAIAVSGIWGHEVSNLKTYILSNITTSSLKKTQTQLKKVTVV